jgi:hypothetical protein
LTKFFSVHLFSCHLYTTISIQPSQYNHFNTTISIQPSQYNHLYITISIQPSQYNHLNTTISIQPLATTFFCATFSGHLNTTISIQPSQYNFCNKTYKHTRDLSPSFSTLWWIGRAAATLLSLISSISSMMCGGDYFVHHGAAFDGSARYDGASAADGRQGDVEETREWGGDISLVRPRTIGGIRLVRSINQIEKTR